MIFGAPLSVSDKLQCVSQTRPQWATVRILVVGVSWRGVVLQNASCARMGRALGGSDGFASAASHFCIRYQVPSIQHLVDPKLADLLAGCLFAWLTTYYGIWAWVEWGEGQPGLED